MGASGTLEVAEIFRRYGAEFRRRHLGELTRAQRRAMSAIETCRTAALGGHVWECDHCQARKISYNSCRNRHCPKCQSLDKERWLQKRCAELLPVPYFHIVFTLPHELQAFALANPRWLYETLFRCASETLLEIAANPKHLGAKIGALAVLHTWSQTLTLHPHLHCIVPGGGLSVNGPWWVWSRKRFFLPVRVLARLFRGKFLAALKAAYQTGEFKLEGPLAPYQNLDAFTALLAALYKKPWVVYSKPPFGGPRQVLQYLARYTHRVAITNQRLLRLEGDEVVFTFKDYARGGQIREMSLPVEEFIRRFLLHILPERFVRIRSYGLLANRHRQRNLALCRKLLRPGQPVPIPSPEPSWCELLRHLTGIDPTLCPECGQGHLQRIETLEPLRSRWPMARPPP
jgi:Putative transposase/Transposase zinc-binding domain